MVDGQVRVALWGDGWSDRMGEEGSWDEGDGTCGGSTFTAMGLGVMDTGVAVVTRMITILTS